MTVASIDIGTNTVLLLIAEIDIENEKIKTISDLHRIPRLGKGLLAGEKIKKEKIDLFLEIMSEFHKIIVKHKVNKIIASATNAFRIASNSDEIIRIVKDKFNIDIEIISGEEEAFYSFLGATSGIKKLEEALVIDIGGGSTELFFGNRSNLEFRKSYQIGTVSATEKFFPNLPPEQPQIDELNTFLQNTFNEISGFDAPKIVSAVAGTPVTLFSMIHKIMNYDAPKIENKYLYLDELENLSEIINKLNPSEVENNYGDILKGREDIILSGCYILLNIMVLLNLDKVMVSSKGIRYGAIANYLQNNN